MPQNGPDAVFRASRETLCRSGSRTRTGGRLHRLRARPMSRQAAEIDRAERSGSRFQGQGGGSALSSWLDELLAIDQAQERARALETLPADAPAQIHREVLAALYSDPARARSLAEIGKQVAQRR